ncbi:MAG: gluconeogenesis factor YvcK family protein [Deltaproteobacteria bacterium]
MRFIDWLRPGLNIKRWVFVGIIGVLIQSYGIAIFMTSHISYDTSTMIGIMAVVSGFFLIIMSIIFIGKTIIKALNDTGFHSHVNSKTIGKMLIEKRYLESGPKMVVIGGGTGLSTMLRGLKSFTSNLTAVVTVSDDGGGSGVLREDLGMLPPGDIRNCILALARTEPILEKLLQYRFTEGMLKGQNFGNLFLAAMSGVAGSFEEAVKKMSHVLAVTGDVLPVTLSDIRLCAELDDKSIALGETNIVNECKQRNTGIKRIFLEPDNPPALLDVIQRIKDADVIVLGPGSLYTSIISNLLVDGICEAINESKAVKVYVCNIMTQRGETDNYTASEHLKAIANNSKLQKIDYCLVNRGVIKESLKQKYNQDGSKRVVIDEANISKMGIKTIKADLIDVEKGLVRHHHGKLSTAIIKLINEEIILKDKKKMIEYFYTKGRIKKIASMPQLPSTVEREHQKIGL